MSPSDTGPSPSPRQLRYLRQLADQTATSFTYPRTKRQASEEIDRLRNLKASTPRLPRLRERSIASDPNLYATAPRCDELTGYGSSAHWRTTNVKDPESIPDRGSTGSRKELARYTISSGERIVYGQRINGSVRITDSPATAGAGRSYVIEAAIEVDGNDAMKALVADYATQARNLDAVPVLSSLVRRDLQREAAD
jgi:hypothetical protein